MLNHITVMGRLTKDPDLRYTPNGIAVASFTIACERDFKGPDGEKETDFFECMAWRNTAEFVSNYFTKGRMAVVSGRLQTRTFQDRETGKNRKVYEIVAEHVYFGDSKKDDGFQGRQTSFGTEIDFTDDDIPF